MKLRNLYSHSILYLLLTIRKWFDFDAPNICYRRLHRTTVCQREKFVSRKKQDMTNIPCSFIVKSQKFIYYSLFFCHLSQKSVHISISISSSVLVHIFDLNSEGMAKRDNESEMREGGAEKERWRKKKAKVVSWPHDVIQLMYNKLAESIYKFKFFFSVSKTF